MLTVAMETYINNPNISHYEETNISDKYFHLGSFFFTQISKYTLSPFCQKEFLIKYFS